MHGSAGGVIGQPDMVPYCTTKAGVFGMTRSCALDLGKHNIRLPACLWSYQHVARWADRNGCAFALCGRCSVASPCLLPPETSHVGHTMIDIADVKSSASKLTFPAVVSLESVCFNSIWHTNGALQFMYIQRAFRASYSRESTACWLFAAAIYSLLPRPAHASLRFMQHCCNEPFRKVMSGYCKSGVVLNQCVSAGGYPFHACVVYNLAIIISE